MGSAHFADEQLHELPYLGTGHSVYRVLELIRSIDPMTADILQILELLNFLCLYPGRISQYC